jgi:hypothetical protein
MVTEASSVDGSTATSGTSDRTIVEPTPRGHSDHEALVTNPGVLYIHVQYNSNSFKACNTGHENLNDMDVDHDDSGSTVPALGRALEIEKDRESQNTKQDGDGEGMQNDLDVEEGSLADEEAQSKPTSTKRKQLHVEEEDQDSEEDKDSKDESDSDGKPDSEANTVKHKSKLTNATRRSGRIKPPTPSHGKPDSIGSRRRKHPKSTKKMPAPSDTLNRKPQTTIVFPSTSRALNDRYVVKFSDLSIKEDSNLKV